MGVIARQSIYSSMITYLGLAIGIFNIYLFTGYLLAEQKGVYDSMNIISGIVVIVCSFGLSGFTNKFIGYYKKYTKSKDNDFLYYISKSLYIPFVLIIGALLGFYYFYLNVNANVTLLKENFIILPIFATGLLISQTLYYYSLNYNLNIYLSFLNEFILRLITLFILIAIINKYMSFETGILIASFSYWIITVLVIIKLKSEGLFQYNKIESNVSRRLKPVVLNYRMNTWVAQSFLVLYQFVDSIMIMSLRGLNNIAYYSFAVQLLLFITATQKSVMNSSTATINDSWLNNDMDNIKSVYEKSANNLLWFGGLVYILIISNTNSILSVIRPEYEAAKQVLLILGIAKLVDVTTGINLYILSLSRKFWKIEQWINMGSFALMLPLNYFLVKNYGIIGSAYSSLMITVVTAVSRTLLLYNFTKLHPFTKKNLLLIFFIVCSVLVCYTLFYNQSIIRQNINFGFIFQVSGKSIIIMTLFLVILYISKLSADFNRLVAKKIK